MRPRFFVDALAAYGLAGAVFAAAFVTSEFIASTRWRSMRRLGFRLIVLPGVAALWPLLLLRWCKGSGHS